MTMTMAVREHAPAPEGKALLASAQAGDPAAQAELFNAYKHQVARQIQRMTGDPSAVDDLVQEVFISAFTALPGFRGDAQFQTWLYTIAANKVRNWWESQRRRERREKTAAAIPKTPPTTPEDRAEVVEHRRRLYDAMGGLSHKLREAFTARAIQGMSLQEASEVLDVPISTVSYRTRRAEALLCEALGIPFGETP